MNIKIEITGELKEIEDYLGVKCRNKNFTKTAEKSISKNLKKQALLDYVTSEYASSEKLRYVFSFSHYGPIRLTIKKTKTK